jgi:integrase/recombinase XerD
LRAERVVAPSGRVGWTVVDAVGVAVAPVEAFLRYRFDCDASPNTLRAYAHDLKLFFGFLAERSLGWRELSPAELGEFVAWLRRPAGNVLLLPGMPPARAASTVNRALSAVVAFYDFHRLQGVELADLMLDPLRSGRGGVRPFLAGIARERARGRRGRLPVARRAPRVLSLEQVARVVAGQSRLRDRLLFVLLFTTGMRIGQALGLRHEDVRLWKRELVIVPREDNANGARGKRGSAVVPLTEEAARLYLLYMEHEYGLLDSDYVFVNLWGGERGRPLNYAAFSRLVARTRKRVGFDFTPHDFRHTFVTLARRGGVRLEVISRLVTHRSVTTTADVYSHLELEDLRAELDAAGLLDPVADVVG